MGAFSGGRDELSRGGSVAFEPVGEVGVGPCLGGVGELESGPGVGRGDGETVAGFPMGDLGPIGVELPPVKMG